MECDAVHRSTGHAEAWGEDGSEACDVDVVNSKGGLFCYRCGGEDHIAAKCATPAPAKSKGKDGRKGVTAGCEGAGKKEKGKGEWKGFCSYCRKKGHKPPDCWTKKDEANNGRLNVGEVVVGGFEIGCVDKEEGVPARATDFQQVQGAEW